MADDPDVAKIIPTSPAAKDFMPGFPTLTNFSGEGLRRVAEASRAFQCLPPTGPLWDLQKSYPEFRRAMKNCRTRIEPLMKLLMEHEKISTHDYSKRVIEEKLDFLIEANDDILERVGTSLDDAEGLFKRAEMVVVNKAAVVNSLRPPGTWGKKKMSSAAIGGDFRDATVNLTKKQPIVPVNVEARPIKKAVHRIRVTEKPQLKFADTIDNSLRPFVPKLTMKPYSIKPLSLLPEYTAADEEFYGHPYEVELNRWEPESSMLESSTPIPPKPLDKTPLVLVVTPDQLETVISELRNVNEIAVDLEHHSFRTFLGLTCLMQISTREKDYVIDTLALWRDLEGLNEIFTNPKVVKVFHGATSDIEWLQRDFGLYVVGLFDTYLAMKQLQFQHFSLQHLLAHFCSVTVDKTYQLADWRLRPLPEEMLHYARQDTHYLLYIYDMLKSQLLEKGNQFKNLLRAVYDQSKYVCLKRYEKPGRNPQLALRKTQQNLNNRQVYAFTGLYNWRDTVAREKDESLGFVLSNLMLLNIAQALPKEMTGILACCDPVPPLVHQHLGEIHRIILRARDLPLHEDIKQHSGQDKRKKQQDWMIRLNSIHDLYFDEEEKAEAEEVRKWPEPFISPHGSDQIILRTSPILPIGLHTEAPKRVKFNETSSAYERYELSNNILEILRDPKQQGGLDLEDPLVRVVRETLLAETLEDKPLCASESSGDIVVRGGLDRVLPEKDFVAFNPMGYGKRRGRKKSPPVTEKKVKVESDVEVIDLEDSMNDAEEEGEQASPKQIVPFPKVKKEKGKNKFMDKVKWMKKKGKKRKAEERDESPRVKESATPKKPRGNSAPQQQQPKGGRSQGGRFFLNPFRAKEGKSVTFKK